MIKLRCPKSASAASFGNKVGFTRTGTPFAPSYTCSKSEGFYYFSASDFWPFAAFNSLITVSAEGDTKPAIAFAASHFKIVSW